VGDVVFPWRATATLVRRDESSQRPASEDVIWYTMTTSMVQPNTNSLCWLDVYVTWT